MAVQIRCCYVSTDVTFHCIDVNHCDLWKETPKMKYPLKRKAGYLQYIPRNMHTVFALLCFVVVIHWLIFPYPSGLLHWHCGNLTIAPVPAKQPWWIWINTSCEFIMNDCITTTKQSTTKPCAYFLRYTVWWPLCCRRRRLCLLFLKWQHPWPVTVGGHGAYLFRFRNQCQCQWTTNGNVLCHGVIL